MVHGQEKNERTVKIIFGPHGEPLYIAKVESIAVGKFALTGLVYNFIYIRHK
jgi:hypothetical protein